MKLIQKKGAAHKGEIRIRYAEIACTSRPRNLHAIRFGPGGSPKFGEPALSEIGSSLLRVPARPIHNCPSARNESAW